MLNTAFALFFVAQHFFVCCMITRPTLTSAEWLAQQQGVSHSLKMDCTYDPAMEGKALSDQYDLLSQGRQNQAASAIAAAAASGTLFKRAAQSCNGRFLERPEDQYIVDHDNASSKAPQLQVSPITMLKTDYKLVMLQQIAVNNTYITYGLKQGHIRVINKLTANRSLFKGHTSAIADMCFLNPDSSVLASTSQLGDTYVRRIFENTPESGIEEEVLFRTAVPMSATTIRRLCWCPGSDSLLIAVAENKLAFCFIPDSSPEGKPSDLTILSCPIMDADIASFCFSADGAVLAVSDINGYVSIWDFPQDLSFPKLQDFAAAIGEPLIRFRPYDTGYAASLGFLVSQMSSFRLFTGNDNNSVLRVWGLGLQQQPIPMQTLALASSEGTSAFFNHLCWETSSQFVVLANTIKQHVYVLHYVVAEDGDGYFDYMSDFSVQLPILSMTSFCEPVQDSDSAGAFSLFCIQTDAIQQYTLDSAACYPAAEATTTVPVLAESTAGDDLPTIPAPPLVTITPPEIPDVRPSVLEHFRQHSMESSSVERSDHLLEALEPPQVAHLPTPMRLLTPGIIKEQFEKAVPSPSTHPALDSNTAPLATAQMQAAPAVAAGPLPATLQEFDALSAPAPPPYDASPLNEELNRASSSEAQETAEGNYGANSYVGSGPCQPNLIQNITLEQLSQVFSEVLSSSQSSYVTQREFELLAVSQRHMLEQVMNNQKENAKAIKAEFGRVLKQTELNVSKGLEQSLKAQLRKLEEDRKKQAVQERDELLRAVAEMNAKLAKDVASRVDETCSAVVSNIVSALGPMVSRALQETLPGVVQSSYIQATLESIINNQLGYVVPKGLSDSLRDNFASTLIPSFERATQTMFAQIDAAFAAGMAEHVKLSANASMELSSSLKQSVNHLTALTQAMKSELLEGQKQLILTMNSTAGQVSKPVDGAPKPTTLAELEARQDPKVLITSMLKSGQYEQAFTTALGLSDVSTVVWLCRQVDPSMLLNKEPLPLSQSVLLSLLQQVGFDLKSDADLKVYWIMEIAPNINPREPPVAGHLKPILQHIMTQLVKLNVQGELAKQVKLTIHLVNSLLHQ